MLLIASANWKFLKREASFDENLSPRLVATLADLYPDSAQVHQCGLGSSDHLVIWQYAKDNGFAIVSKDSEFEERSVLRGHPPKIIWHRVGNCASAEIAALLRAAAPIVSRFIQEDRESVLVLRPHH